MKRETKFHQGMRRIWVLLIVLITFLGISSGAPDKRSHPAQAAGLYHQYLPVTQRNYPLMTPFGVQTTKINASGGLDQIHSAQITWVRRNGVRWYDVEPSPGARNWSANASLEAELKNAFNRGIRVILVVRGTPSWAQKIPGYSCGPIAANHLQAFGDFMYDLVSRYKAPPYNIKYWEIWNEPDAEPAQVPNPNSVFGCWGDTADKNFGGAYYAEMLKYIYPRIKSADPSAQVLVGGLLLDCNPIPGAGICSPTSAKAARFLRGILNHYGLRDGANFFDGISFHAFDFYSGSSGQYGNSNWKATSSTTGPVLAAKAGFIRGVLSEFGVSDKFLLNTESAILCDMGCGPIFESTKAAYIAQNYTVAQAEGLIANIWLSVFGWRNSGLLHPDLTPRPAFYSLQTARARLANAVYLGPINAGDVSSLTGLMGHKFSRAGKEVWVIWSADGVLRTVNLPGVPAALYDYLGSPLTPGGSITLDMFPKYIEWN